MAVFLDKDGTIINDVPYNVDPNQITLSDGAGTGLNSLYHAGFQLIVISNQSGVARGFFPEDALAGVEARLRELLETEADVALSGFYYCPHHPDGVVTQYAISCACRKPQPGMILQAAKELGIDLKTSWLIGDTLDDVEAGRRAGCRTILINNGNETEWVINPDREPHFIVQNLEEAARTIVAILISHHLDSADLSVE